MILFTCLIHLSQTELAHLLDIPSQSKISSWENNTCVPDVFEAQKLAQIFGVSLEELLKESWISLHKKKGLGF